MTDPGTKGARGARALGEGIRVAVDQLGANPLRTGLTVLGVAVGVGVVVTMASLVTGIRSSVLEGFEAAGPRNFILTRFDMSEVRLVPDGSGRPPWWNTPKVTESEADRIGRLAEVQEAIVDVDFSATLSYRGQRVTDVPSSANSDGWPAYTVGAFADGRNFLASEVRRSRTVVVVSRALAQELFGPLDPVGRRIRISAGSASDELFTVVGVFAAEGQIFADAVRNFAVLPYTTALRRLRVADDFLSVLVVPRDDVSQQAVMDQVTGALRSMRGLGPGAPNDFALLRSDQLADLFDQLTGVFFLVLLALSSVGLLVGGVGVIGIMMISVTERTREIGVRMAVGAARREILWQFLVEASLLTLVGGALGLTVGMGAAEAVSAYTPIPARIPVWSVAAALGMAGLTGLGFGLLPAVRASRMDPVTALGHE